MSQKAGKADSGAIIIMPTLYLPFSPDGKTGTAIKFSGDRPCFLGEKLAELLNLTLTERDDADTVFTDGSIAGNNILQKVYGEFEIYEQENFTIMRQLSPEKCVFRNGKLSMRQLLPCAVRRAWQKGIQAALLHGAMLVSATAPDECTLVFGVSGMGKSTAATRWKKNNGTAPADDMVLIYKDREGVFYARPMPTWSRFPEKVDFNICCKVKNILRLQRGGFDCIAPSESTVDWSIDCTRGLMFNHYLPELKREKSSDIAEKCMQFSEELHISFGANDLFTGNISAPLTLPL
jgi:hypothetical protein